MKQYVQSVLLFGLCALICAGCNRSTGSFDSSTRSASYYVGSNESVRQAVEKIRSAENSGTIEISITGTLSETDFQALKTAFEYGIYLGGATDAMFSLDLSGAECTSIPASAFSGCSTLTHIVLPDTVSDIGAGAFKNTGLTEIKLPPNLTLINENVFSGTALTAVVIPEGVAAIGASAFAYSALASVELPSGLIKIDSGAFEYCKLSSVSLPAGLTDIGNRAFYHTYITSIEIPAAVASIGASAFYAASRLTSVVVNAANPPTASFTRTGSWNAFGNSAGILQITVPEG